MPEMSLDEAATRLGLSRSTVTRRVVRGEISGRKETAEGGDIWVITLPDEEGESVVDNLPPEASAEHGDFLPEVLIEEDQVLCVICHRPIDDADEYVVAAYGMVHMEPCSHQSFQG